jgi:hypothetical protein
MVNNTLHTSLREAAFAAKQSVASSERLLHPLQGFARLSPSGNAVNKVTVFKLLLTTTLLKIFGWRIAIVIIHKKKTFCGLRLSRF